MVTRQDRGSVNRRHFLAGTAAAGAVALAPARVFGTRANAEIRLGMIGCGGRGNWIAELFRKSGKYRLIACADYFQDRVDAFGERFGVEPARRFPTLSGYKRLLDTELDAVVIESPPYFHPEQAAAAVAAGRHVYVAKPVAVDVPGCQSIAESGRRATAQDLVFLVDFQTRADDVYRETLRRVRQDGAIGRLVSAEARYPWSGNVADVATPTAEDRLRAWYGTLALSGDVIVEQDIHAIDVACWFAGADPIKAYGSGGRAVRQHGNIFDHFSVTYHFPDDFLVTFTSQKAVPGAPEAIRCTVFGTEGVADTDYVGQVAIAGKHPFPGGRMTDLYGRGARRNIDDFYDLIAAGDCRNATVGESVRSNLACVLGRTAAYQKREVSWKEMLDTAEELKPDLAGAKG